MSDALREKVAKLLCKRYDGNPEDIWGHTDLTGLIKRWHGHRDAADELFSTVVKWLIKTVGECKCHDDITWDGAIDYVVEELQGSLTASHETSEGEAKAGSGEG